MTETENPRIYIVNDAGHRYDLALRQIPNGKLIPLTVGNVNPTQVDRLSYELSMGIAHSRASDYLLLSGTPVLNALSGMLWILLHKKMNLLVFDAKTQGYSKMIVDAENLKRLIDDELLG